jgi:hypothetical protein
MRIADNKQQLAFIRFVDAYSKPADLYVRGQKAFTSELKSVSEYKGIPAGRVDFVVGEPGIASGSETLNDGRYYTIIVSGEKDAKANLRIVNDTELAPASGKAKVRIIPLAPGLDTMALYVMGHNVKVANESPVGGSSAWQEIDVVTGPLELRTSDGNGKPVPLTNVTLQPGKMYTFVAFRDQNDDASVIPVVDNPKDSKS